jgi:hypothetical protein
MTRLEAAAHAPRLKRSEKTVWRWARAGCDFDNPESIKAFLIEAKRKRTNVAKARERRGSAAQGKCARCSRSWRG